MIDSTKIEISLKQMQDQLNLHKQLLAEQKAFSKELERKIKVLSNRVDQSYN